MREFVSLAQANPALAKEWHPTKNGELTPDGIGFGSDKKVWWLLKYYDKNTNQTFNFEWEASVGNRSRGTKCPFLSGQAIYVGFNDLQTLNPQLASEWHPTKNGNLTPRDVTVRSTKKVWWLFPYDDTQTGKHFDFEWNEPIQNRIRAPHSNPYLSGKKIMPGFNDLATKRPDIAEQWDYDKNDKELSPLNVTVGSDKKVWWKCKNGHSWSATVSNRTHGYGCPHCYALSRKSKSK